MPTKLSLLFDLSTDPTDLVNAESHKGGWSETIWWPTSPVPNLKIQTLANVRAPLLPQSARIIGYRAQTYTQVNGQLVAGGTASGALGIVGNSYVTDVPQMALGLKASSGDGNNTRRFSLRGIPDVQIQHGEFQPTAPYMTLLRNYIIEVVNGGWAFAGRDLSQPTSKIVSIINGVLITEADNQFVVGNYCRLLKCKNDKGKNVTGRFRVASLTAGNSYVLQGFPADIVVNGKGSARNERFDVFDIDGVLPTRAEVRKVGGPFEKYRGRRSKSNRAF